MIGLLITGVPALAMPTALCDRGSYVCAEPGEGRFALAVAGQPAALYADRDDFRGVLRAVRDLQTDLGQVVDGFVDLELEALPSRGAAVVIGTIGRSALVDGLIRDGKVDTSGVSGQWEAFLHQVVDEPWPGVDQVLVIAGSDMRGTIFGVYDLAREIGVSPWYWWADVPVRHRPELYVLPGRRTQQPAVHYRGIFINDENPALLGWVNETFGGFNHQFYEHVFELILRMKGNYLWPAMWGKAIADDDPLSPALADEMGVVLGTSHHEPLMRAHVEWERYGSGAWDYRVNPDTLRAFWRTGIERMGDFESVVTIGMRGDGDEPMTEGTAIELLEQIVADQREIIADVTGAPAEETPQIWALYKEVQDYYDSGMDVPDDVTLLFADDNWGNIRRLPALGSERPGGYGVYYHYDYVGGPRSYKWLNTNQIERVWEQMYLAHQYGADRMWIVNVGDIKPMEFPTEFFLDYAWDPEAWPLDRLPEYTRAWAARKFGEAHAEEIAELLTRYTQYNARRKPELLSPETYSLVHFREAERIVSEWNTLEELAVAVRQQLPSDYDDAYFQLVHFPVLASANLNRLYIAASLNRLYAHQGRAATNDLAAEVERLFERDAELTRMYHEDVADGKWVHIMSQTHIGYTNWQEPPENVMPEVKTLDVSAEASMGVAVEGDRRAWPAAGGGAELPVFDRYRQPSHYVEVFNQGTEPFTFTATPAEPWVRVMPSRETVDSQARLTVSVDWDVAPSGTHRVPITVYGSEGTEVVVYAPVENPTSPAPSVVNGFVEAGGYVAMEAEHYARAVETGGITWRTIPELGRTLSGVTSFPVTASASAPGGDGPRLEYDVHLFRAGEVEIQVVLAPTLDFRGQGGLRYAISVGGEEPQIVNVHADESLQAWEQSVADNVHVRTTTHRVAEPGPHTVRVWRVDPGLVFGRVVVVTEELPPSYLGPPESPRFPASPSAP